MAVRFTDNSGDVLAKLHEAVADALDVMGMTAASNADAILKSLTHNSSGNLAGSISHQVQGETVYVGTDVNYAIYNEFGTGIYAGGRQTPWSYQDGDGNWHTTRGMPPKHFLKRAVSEHASEYKQIAEEVIKKRMS